MDKQILDLGLEVEKQRNLSGERFRVNGELKEKILHLLKEGKSGKELSFVTGLPRSTILSWSERKKEKEQQESGFEFKEVQLTDSISKTFETSIKIQLSLEQLKMILNQC